jgi:predicted HTH domain antitoxin
MNISFDVNLPPDVEERLRAEAPDLSRAGREAFAVDLFRRGILSHHGLGQALGLDRFETDALLKRHRVTEQSLTHEDVDADVLSLNELLAPPRP